MPSLFADSLIMYIENHKDSPKKILKVINKFCKFTVYKVNTQE